MEKFIKSLRTGVCVLLLANSFCLTAYAAPQENVRDGKEPEPDAMGVIPQIFYYSALSLVMSFPALVNNHLIILKQTCRRS